MTKLYVELARTVLGYNNCINSNNHELRTVWKLKHAQRLAELVREHMPSGSGVDNGTSFNIDKSNGERLVFETSFHHMDEHGGYDGWTDHTVVVTASLLCDFNLRITGENRNGIKDYLYSLFQIALSKEV